MISSIREKFDSTFLDVSIFRPTCYSNWVVLTGTAALGIISIVALRRLCRPSTTIERFTANFHKNRKKREDDLSIADAETKLTGLPLERLIANFHEYRSIKAHDLGIAVDRNFVDDLEDDWNFERNRFKKVDKTLPVLFADEFLHLNPNLLRNFGLKKFPPIAFTFRGALQFVINSIMHSPKIEELDRDIRRIGVRYEFCGLESQFLYALKTIYSPNVLQSWFYIILSFLQKEGIILSYGERNGWLNVVISNDSWQSMLWDANILLETTYRSGNWK